MLINNGLYAIMGYSWFEHLRQNIVQVAMSDCRSGSRLFFEQILAVLRFVIFPDCGEAV